MEKLSNVKFKTLEKSELHKFRGGDDPGCNSVAHDATFDSSSTVGGDTHHVVRNDNGSLVTAWDTRGNTVPHSYQ